MTVEKTINSRFPHADIALDRIAADKNPSWLKALGYVLLLMGAAAIDLPGAVIKAGKDFKQQLKKSPLGS